MSGIGRFRGRSCIVLGHERGHDTDTRIKHNFGMARPRAYRKADRLMTMADRFKLPIITSSTRWVRSPARKAKSTAFPKPSPTA